MSVTDAFDARPLVYPRADGVDGTKGIIAAMLVTLLLVALSQIHFLWFHALAELFAIVVGIALYIIAATSYVFTRNHFLKFLAQGFFWAACLDVLHTLSYRGMGLVSGDDPNPATQLWLCARALEAGVLLLAPRFLGARELPHWSMWGIGAVAVGSAALVVTGYFPDAFVLGQGLTPFKVTAEYAIIAVLLLAAVHAYRKRRQLDAVLYRLVLAVIALTIVSEFAFTLYLDVYGLSNLVGHIAKFWAFALLLLAVTQWMLAQPFRLLARDAGSFESVPIPVLLLDRDGVIQSSNRAARKRFADGGAGKTLHQVWHPHGRPVEQCQVCRAIEQGNAIEYELHAPDQDEWAAVSLQPVWQGDQLQGFVCVHEDITASKRAELAQRAADTRLRTVLDGAADAVFVVNPQAHFLYVNQQAERLLGFGAAELRQMAIADMVPAEERGAALTAFREVLTAGSNRTELHLAHRDGRAIPVDINAVRLPDGNVVASVRDISERVLAAQKLAHQGALLRRIMDSIPDLIFFKDCGSVYLGCNAAFERYFGHKEAEIVGKTDFDFVDAATAEFYRTKDQAMLAGGVPRTNEEWISYPDGTRALLETLKTPYHGGDGRLLGLIGISRDITQRHLAEQRAHANEQRYRALFENMLEGYAHCRLLYRDGKAVDFVYLDVNDKFSALTGLRDVIGRPVSEVLPGIHEGSPEILQRYARVVATRKPERFELFVPHLQIWLLISAFSFEQDEFVAVFDNITERKNYESQLEHQANHDALTGLANRNLLGDRLAQALVFARRAGRQVAVMLLDLDRFKLVNDGMGHDAGDNLLRIIAQRLAACVRPGDTVARLGGDEFVLVMSDMAQEGDAMSMAAKVLAEIQRPAAVNDHEVIATASLGVTLFPRDGDDPADLLKNADAAMYRAKEVGRNRFEFYSPEMNTRSMERLELEVRLRRALEAGELVLHYQPKVELRRGRVIGAEALLRWRGSGGEMIPPGDFIPLAEETGLIVGIGEWVIDTACARLRQWRDTGLGGLQLAVNVSARQFQDENLVKVVTAALQRHGVEPEQLELEVTESVAMRDPERTIVILRELKQVGVRISLDDFGTGYSSLSYLKRFPIDKLKIDRTFVHDVTVDPEDAAIALSVISLAHSLKREVIAEGVETEAQMYFLRRHGCDTLQGFLFARPLPAEEFAALYLSGKSLDLPPESTPRAADAAPAVPPL